MKDNKDLYQVMPPLTDEEYKTLKEDIKEHGVMVPVEIDEAGHILDGYHRVKACKELGITDFPTIVREGWTEEEKYEHALRLNVRRRHLSGEQLKEVIRDFKEKHPDVSNRQVAKAVGVDPHTVATSTDEFATGEIPQLQKSIGGDGKSRPSSEAQAEQQRQDIRDAIKKDPDANNHQIAQSLGVSDHTVERQRQALDDESKAGELSSSVQKEDEEEKPYIAPYSMNSSAILSKIILEEADSTKDWLHSLIYDCSDDPEKEAMLSSQHGAEEVIKALIASKESIDKTFDEAIAHLKHHKQDDDHKDQER